MNINKGLHHITVLAGDPQKNVDFYVKTLGLRFALKSVNQDESGTYHFFYTNGSGQPGSGITFFPFPMAALGKTGSGEAVAVSFALADFAMDYWTDRLIEHDISFESPFERLGHKVIRFDDPDGLTLEFVFDKSVNVLPAFNDSPVPEKYGIRGFWGTTLRLANEEGTAEVLEKVMGFRKVESDENFSLYKTDSSIGHTVMIEKPELPSAGRAGRGTVHHIAFRVKDEKELDEKRLIVADMDLQPTGIIDRFVFKSVYFRSPGGVLFEMATDGPGYYSAQGEKELGKKLFLPPWLENQRERIEQNLPKIKL